VANPESPDADTRVAVLEHRADATDRALELLRHDVNQGFAALRDHMDQRFTEVDRRFDQVDQRFDRVDQRFAQADQRGDRQDTRLDQMNDRLERMNSRLDQHFRWIVTTVITTAFAIIGANIGILTLLLRAR
jgi:chromosome segregation ATPase